MWDPFQREVLAAMGHAVLVPAAREPMAAPAPASASVGQPSPGATSATDATGSAGLPPALLAALLRAAGADDTGGLGPLPAPAVLRTAAGKRALWPQLRALRKARRR